jgi:hypothetical protein
MTRRTAAFGLAISAIVLALTGTLLVVGGPTTDLAALLPSALQLATLLTTAVVGLVLALRQPRNPIGWLFGWLALAEAATFVARGYATHAFSGAAPLPGAEWAAWFGNWSGNPATALVVQMFLVFPSGRLVSPRWRPALLLPPLVALGYAARAFVPGPMNLLGVPNPLGVAWVPLNTWSDGGAGGVPLLIGGIVAFAQLVVRYRAAGTTERQQIKCLALPVLALIIAAVVTGVTEMTGLGQDTRRKALVSALFNSVSVLLPLGMGIAVLRYRLYDIDVLINRTLVYGATTAGIAAAFFTGIVVLQALLRPLTSGSELAVAASTLVSVALFQPLRRRIQRAVDRRFYRSNYDAERTLDAFAARLRDEVDLEALERELVGVVNDTMQPTQASVWLRKTTQ